MRIAVLLSMLGCLQGQSVPARSALGQMIDRQQQLRPLYGVGGTFNVGSPIADHVLSAACSAAICLAKTESALISAGVRIPAPPGPAIIAVGTAAAAIYFPSTGQFGRWQNGTLTMLSLRVDGTVLSLASNSAGLVMAVERLGIVWILSADGTALDSLPAGTERALLTAGGIVYATSTGLFVRRGDGSELSFPAPGVSALIAIGADYVEAQAGAVLYVLRTTPGREQLFQLPQPQEPRR